MSGSRGCAWPQCGRRVTDGRLMCKAHWIALPAPLRARIWQHYTPGQEATSVSEEYLDALHDVLRYAAGVVVEQAARRAQRQHVVPEGQDRLW